MNKRVLIIGAGIHGCTVAIGLASKSYDVTIIDKKEDMLFGSSFATHNRIHLGYHYARSKETRIECKKGYDYFFKNFKECLIFPEFYYLIDKEKSYVNVQEYKNAMEEIGLECVSSWPDEKFLNREKIEDSFKVREACFDIWKIRDIFKNKFKELNIKEIYNFGILKATNFDKNKIRLISSSSMIELDVDLIVNCTYAYTNNIQKAFSIFEDLTPYKFQTTEVAVVESDIEIPALTVTDGPFITILPYAGKKNHYLVYDVINSVVHTEIGLEYKFPEISHSNWEKMLEHGLKYYPVFKNLKYKFSLYGNRPIPLKAKNDERTTKIIKHDYPIDFYSILEGKFVSAPVFADKLVKVIEEQNRLEKRKALIGYTGFIGSNLKNSSTFDDFYNSKNIEDIEGKKYELIVSCGNPGTRWIANQNPKDDFKNILQFIEHIKKVKANQFVLISTIDVFENPIGAYEDTDFGNLDKNPYGKHRLYLENFVKNHFENFLIVRLPHMYGKNFKKNFIYDALHNNELHKINTKMQVQIYNVKNLMNDINLALKNKLKFLNLATEPISIEEIYQEIFNLHINNSISKEFKYDMRTKYSEIFGKEKDYIYNKQELLNELKQFKEEYELMFLQKRI